MEIDWGSTETQILLNPRSPTEQSALAKKLLPITGSFSKHLWLGTSGSTRLKYVALSKEAFLASAANVNIHLNIQQRDIWVNPLPLFHVGGLGILARAFLSQSSVVMYEEKWNPISFCKILEYSKATFSSLVPTQIFDLVTQQLSAPPYLRGIIVGGGPLSPFLYQQAYDLGWPLLPSYGATEAASQIATAQASTAQYPPMIKLPHLEMKVNESGFFCLKGPSLFTAYAHLSDDGCLLSDPKENGWYITEDKGLIEDKMVTVFGRGDSFVKINGENVNLNCLESLLKELKHRFQIKTDMALIALPHERLGHAIHLAVSDAPKPHLEALISAFQSQVMPFERIYQVHYGISIPRSPLNKLLKNHLLNYLK